MPSRQKFPFIHNLNFTFCQPLTCSSERARYRECRRLRKNFSAYVENHFLSWFCWKGTNGHMQISSNWCWATSHKSLSNCFVTCCIFIFEAISIRSAAFFQGSCNKTTQKNALKRRLKKHPSHCILIWSERQVVNNSNPVWFKHHFLSSLYGKIGKTGTRRLNFMMQSTSAKWILFWITKNQAYVKVAFSGCVQLKSWSNTAGERIRMTSSSCFHIKKPFSM